MLGGGVTAEGQGRCRRAQGQGGFISPPGINRSSGPAEYRALYPKGKDPSNRWGGIIVGSGTIGLRQGDERPDYIYNGRVLLTILKVNGESIHSRAEW